MIKENNTMIVFNANMHRTNMLITAIEKIKAYNWLYQQKAYENDIEYGKLVKSIQNQELEEIEKSCTEHAKISLSTTFEVFLKDLIQELLFNKPEYFLKTRTSYYHKLKTLIEDSLTYEYDSILKNLNLNNRYDFINFLGQYGIILLDQNQKNLVDIIYIYRNNYVHSGSKLDSKTKKLINDINKSENNNYSEYSIKKLRNAFSRLIQNIHKKALIQIEQ